MICFAITSLPTESARLSASRQSQFSRQIKELEDALGARLLDRVGKTLRPTSFGLRLARMSRVYLGGVVELAAGETEKPRLLNVGGDKGLLRWLFIPAMRSLRGMTPRIDCRLRSLRSELVVRELDMGKIDVGLVRGSALDDQQASESIGTFRFTMVVPRLLLRSRTGEEVFQGKPLAFGELMGAGQLVRLTREIATSAGIRLNRVIEAETLSLLMAALEQGEAAAFIPTVAASQLPSERFARLRIDGIERLDRRIVLTWLPESGDQQPFVRQAVHVLARSLSQTMTELDRIDADAVP